MASPTPTLGRIHCEGTTGGTIGHRCWSRSLTRRDTGIGASTPCDGSPRSPPAAPPSVGAGTHTPNVIVTGPSFVSSTAMRAPKTPAVDRHAQLAQRLAERLVERLR